ncbi:MAG TPA: hypothetical protein VM305_01070 [Candidatus Limnocylindrales bacterium]|nr:hypothetical protein [Candidatus Limnocylindrales bacterium]
MLPVETWFQSMSTGRSRLGRSRRPAGAGRRLRQRIGNGLISLGMLIAADGRRVVLTNGR